MEFGLSNLIDPYFPKEYKLSIILRFMKLGISVYKAYNKIIIILPVASYLISNGYRKSFESVKLKTYFHGMANDKKHTVCNCLDNVL
jgi:hypothetical protein